MRRLLGALLVAALLAPPAGAALDPRVFVLSQADVPRGYEFDKDNSLLMTRAMVDRTPTDKDAQALARAGFVNADVARYTRYGLPQWTYVNSAAYAFRQPGGAQAYMRRMKTGLGRSAGRPQRIALGDEGWLYTMSSTDTGTAVLWRHGRVVALVSCLEMTRHRSLALALSKRQQRRIMAALR